MLFSNCPANEWHAGYGSVSLFGSGLAEVTEPLEQDI